MFRSRDPCNILEPPWGSPKPSLNTTELGWLRALDNTKLTKQLKAAFFYCVLLL